MTLAYIGDDYPAYYPIDIPPVYLTPENTIHYQIYTEDAAREWSSIFPQGGGFLRLGPHDRLFGIALFHQMHCLRILRRSLESGDYSRLHPVKQGHIHHCFTYLRQWTLCSADVTLEPAYRAEKEGMWMWAADGVGSVHRCRDWTAVRRYLEEHPARSAAPVEGEEDPDETRAM